MIKYGEVWVCRRFCAVMAALLLLGLLTACGGEAMDADVVFVNGTDAPVYRVGVEHSGGAEVGMNADGAPMKREDSLCFELEEYPARIVAIGADEAALAETVIRQPGPWSVRLTRRESGGFALEAVRIQPDF